MKLHIKKPLILASKSPRRRELLQNLFKDLCVIPSCFDETSIEIKIPDEHVKKQSLCKTNTIAKFHPNSCVVGADTIVTIDNDILGKPHNENNATNMLKRLNGKTHQVYTGYTIMCLNTNLLSTKVVSTDVKFKSMTPNEIKYYVSTGESFDKSGGYSIQGIGSFMIKKIYGSYTNVMGLPICELLEDLIQLKMITGHR